MRVRAQNNNISNFLGSTSLILFVLKEVLPFLSFKVEVELSRLKLLKSICFSNYAPSDV